MSLRPDTTLRWRVERNDEVGTEDISVAKALSWCCGLLMVTAALVTSADVAADVAAPQHACEEQLPFAEGLVVVGAERAWPPPLVRCVWNDTDLGQTDEYGDVSALSAQHVAVVAVLDAAAMSWLVVKGRRRLSAKRSRSNRRSGSA